MAENQAIESIFPEFAQNSFLQGIRCSPTVNQADPEASDLEDLPIGDALDEGIHVAAYDVDGSIGKSHQDIRIDHVAGVQNDFGVGEVTLRDRVQKRIPLFDFLDMRIGKHTNFQYAIPI
jgi:hypothetical protein